MLLPDVRHAMWDVVAMADTTKGEVIDNAIAELIMLYDDGEYKPDPQFRKPGKGAKSFNICLERWVQRELEVIAQEFGVSMGALLREAITSYVELCDDGIIKM